MEIARSIFEVLCGRRMLLIWSTIVAMTMPWIMMGCGKSDDDAGAGAATAQDNDLTDYGPCHDIVELAKQKDWSTGNKCNNCVISSTSNPLDVVQLVSTWQTDSKNGVFSYIDDHFQSAFKRGETDFMFDTRISNFEIETATIKSVLRNQKFKLSFELTCSGHIV